MSSARQSRDAQDLDLLSEIKARLSGMDYSGELVGSGPLLGGVYPLIDQAFVDRMGAKMRLFHATSSPSAFLSNSLFEDAFVDALNVSGHRRARASKDPTIEVGDVRLRQVGVGKTLMLSLKTVGTNDAKRRGIHLSKLMEAAWINRCESRADFCRHIKDRLVSKVMATTEILVLRAFGRMGRGDGRIKYDLTRVPTSIFKALENVEEEDIVDISIGSTGSAKIISVGGHKLPFEVAFYGSDGKITLRNVQVFDTMARWSLG